MATFDPATHAAIGSGVLSLNPASALGAFLQQKAGEKMTGNKGRSTGDYMARGGSGGAAIGAGAGRCLD